VGLRVYPTYDSSSEIGPSPGEGFNVRHLSIFAASMACVCACGGLNINPQINEHRTVHLEQDKTKTLTVTNAMEWFDTSPPTHELRFPAGIYVLEGEDDDYWYMRSNVPLQFSEFKKGGRADSRSIPGGIAIGKYVFRAVPAAGYIDGEGSTRILVWKLSSDFLGREGKDWKKSF
jgi:hypothetical protein